MQEQLRFDFGKGPERQPNRLLVKKPLIEGLTELPLFDKQGNLKRMPYSYINRYPWLMWQIEQVRGVTRVDATDSGGLSMWNVAVEFLGESARKYSRLYSTKRDEISETFARKERLSKYDFAVMLTLAEAITPRLDLADNPLRHPGGPSRACVDYWSRLNSLYLDSEWPGSD